MCTNSDFRKQVWKTVMLAVIFLSNVAPLTAEPVHPAWWNDRGVKNASTAQNKGVANMGQLKHIATQAHAELESLLLGGAGYVLPFDTPPANPDTTWYENQKKALNLGQLKAVAKPMYDRLNAISPAWVETQLQSNGLATLGTDYFKDPSTNYFYPWNPATPVAENYKPATVGQLKLVFALHFNTVTLSALDTDGDGLSDAWEIANGLDPNDPNDASADPDGDGLTNEQENALGTDPNSVDQIGPVDLGFAEQITGSQDTSFRDEYPSDLYHQSIFDHNSTPTWQAVIGEYIEVWDEGDGNTYVELQSHWECKGIKQKFDMLPNSELTFILRYKGRYDNYNDSNPFALKVEGAHEFLIDGQPAQSQGGMKQQSFMMDDEMDKYTEWQYSTVTIITNPQATSIVPITLTLVPDDTDLEITHGGFVDLLPVELVDTKDKVFDDLAPQGTTITAAMRDVSIEPKKDADDKNPKSIAWIDPHGSDDTVDAPDMPQLALRFRGTEQMSLKIKWKLEVIYDRPRGNSPDEQRIKDQDEVFIPKKSEDSQPWKEEVLTDAVKFFDHPDWNTELQEKGFFGGEAKLTYQLLKADGGALGSEETMLFRIGGKNPDPAKCKEYIDDNASSAHGNMWFAYAIAKSESSAFNPERCYNQFWERTGRYDKRPHNQGEPTWAKASWEESAGGFGLFQVTGRVQNTPLGLNGKFYNIDRQEIWNWQKHVSAGLAIIRSKQDAIYDGTWDYMNGTMPHRKMAGQSRGQRVQAKQSHNGNDVAVPDEVVRSVTFRDGTARPIESAVTIKAYNGATRHYVGWNNTTKKWEFFRTNGKFNYVDRVCQEVE